MNQCEITLFRSRNLKGLVFLSPDPKRDSQERGFSSGTIRRFVRIGPSRASKSYRRDSKITTIRWQPYLRSNHRRWSSQTLHLLKKSGGALSPEVENPPRASRRKIAPSRLVGVLSSVGTSTGKPPRGLLRGFGQFFGVWTGRAPSSLHLRFP